MKKGNHLYKSVKTKKNNMYDLLHMQDMGLRTFDRNELKSDINNKCYP